MTHEDADQDALLPPSRQEADLPNEPSSPGSPTPQETGMLADALSHNNTAPRAAQRDLRLHLNEKLHALGSGLTAASYLGIRSESEYRLAMLADVVEVLPVTDLTPVRHTQPWFLGVINIRGIVFSVIDLPHFLGKTPCTITTNSRLVLLRRRLISNAALLVDGVLGLRTAEQMQKLAEDKQPRTPREDWDGDYFYDAQQQVWQELRLNVLAEHPRFMQVGLPMPEGRV